MSVTRSRAPKRSASSSRSVRMASSSPSGMADNASRIAGVVEPGQGGRLPVTVGDREKPLEELSWIGPAADVEEVDELDQQARLAVAPLPHGVHQPTQSGEEPVVPDAQKRTARHVPHAGRLDDDRARPPFRETCVPVADGVGDEAVLGRAPGHHRRDPGALRQAQGAETNRREQARRAPPHASGPVRDGPRSECVPVASTCALPRSRGLQIDPSLTP